MMVTITCDSNVAGVFYYFLVDTKVYLCDMVRTRAGVLFSMISDMAGILYYFLVGPGGFVRDMLIWTVSASCKQPK